MAVGGNQMRRILFSPVPLARPLAVVAGCKEGYYLRSMDNSCQLCPINGSSINIVFLERIKQQIGESNDSMSRAISTFNPVVFALSLYSVVFDIENPEDSKNSFKEFTDCLVSLPNYFLSPIRPRFTSFGFVLYLNL
jgi:hypothetical protein